MDRLLLVLEKPITPLSGSGGGPIQPWGGRPTKKLRAIHRFGVIATTSSARSAVPFQHLNDLRLALSGDDEPDQLGLDGRVGIVIYDNLKYKGHEVFLNRVKLLPVGDGLFEFDRATAEAAQAHLQPGNIIGFEARLQGKGRSVKIVVTSVLQGND